MEEFNIPQIDLVIVDFIPIWKKTVAIRSKWSDIIEIDIGGISLIVKTLRIR
jgi:AICAR transformylase/IMP cyclohydrolase PurH